LTGSAKGEPGVTCVSSGDPTVTPVSSPDGCQERARNRFVRTGPRWRVGRDDLRGGAGRPRAGQVESTNKRLVGRRCKQGGMIWSEVGLEAMVALRVAFYNPSD
jgi:hypothetical protein